MKGNMTKNGGNKRERVSATYISLNGHNRVPVTPMWAIYISSIVEFIYQSMPLNALKFALEVTS